MARCDEPRYIDAMPSLAHEVLVVLLRERPELLSTLLQTLELPPLPDGLTVQDSALRLTEPIELRPDLVLACGTDGAWVLVEVQLEVDLVKKRRWPLAAAMLYDARGVMGDLVVLTSQRSVAQWATDAAHAAGPLGTHFGLRPVVVLLSGDTVNALLSDEHPELGFFAAWAMRERRGKEAKRVVTRALQLAAQLPEALQQTQVRAIFNVLSEPMLNWLKEVAVNPQTLPESPAVRAWREEIEARGRHEGELQGELRGEAQALLSVLTARGFSIDETVRQRVLACTDKDLLERWLVRAVTADALTSVFAH